MVFLIHFAKVIKNNTLLSILKSSVFFLNNGKKAKHLSLAPIAVKILVYRGSAHKIEANSGTNAC